MSDEPKSLQQKSDEYFSGGRPEAPRFENDDEVLDAVGRAFFPERFPPEPESTVREVIPPGYVKHPEAAKYEEARTAKDFEAVPKRMLRTLDPHTVQEAETDYETFNLQFAATREAMRQESEERVAKAKEAIKEQLKKRDRERKILANVGSGDFRTMDEAARIAEKYPK